MRLNTRFAIILLLVTAFSSAAIHLAHGFQLRRTAGILLLQADERIKAEKPGEAAGYLDRYVRLVPEDTAALARLGLALADVGSDARAFIVLDQVLRREPQRGAERRKIVDVAMRIGRYSDAVAHLEKRLIPDAGPARADAGTRRRGDAGTRRRGDAGIPPPADAAGATSAELFDLVGQCRAAMGDPQAALAAYEQATRLAPDAAETHLRLATLLGVELEQAQRADEVLDRLVERNDRSFAAYVARARYRLAAAQRNVPEAEAARLEQAADADLRQALVRLGRTPDNVEVLLLAAEAARKNGDAERTRQHLVRGIELDAANPGWYQVLAAVELDAGNTDQAIAALRRGLAAIPGQQDLQWNVADLLIQTEQVEAAEELIQGLTARDYPRVPLAYLTARVAISKEQWLEASQTLERNRAAMVEWPDLAKQADFWLGQCYERLGNVDQQLAAYRRAAETDRRWIPARLGLAAALVSTGRLDEAIEQYQGLAAQEKTPVEVAVYLARLMVVQQLRLAPDRRNWRPVEQVLDAASGAVPDSADLVILRAEVLVAQANAEGARTLLAEASGRTPSELKLRLAQAALAQRQNEWDSALAVLDAAEQQLGDSVDLRLARLRYLVQKLGPDATQELPALEQQADAFTAADQVRLRRGLAASYYSVGQRAEARRLWQWVAEHEPNDMASRLFLFDLAYMEAARLDDAETKASPPLAGQLVELLAEIRRIERAQPGPLWRYGEAARLVFLAKRGQLGELPRARTLLTEARLQRPAWSRIPLLEAEIDELEQNLSGAAERYAQAVELGDRNPSIVRRLVQLLYRQQRYVEADQVLRKLEEQQTPFTVDLGRLAAEVSLRVEDFTRALDMARRTAERSSDYRDQIWLGQLLRVLGQATEAERALRKAIELAEQKPEAWVALVQHFARTQQTAKVEAVMNEARAKVAADDQPLVLAQCAEAMSQTAEAREHYRRAVSAKPHDLATLRTAADFHLRNREPAEAAPLLRQMLAAETNLPAQSAPGGDLAWARRNLALVLASEGNYQKFRQAMGLLDKNLKADPNSQDDRRARAALLSAQPVGRHRQEAIGIFDELLRQSLATESDRYTLAMLYKAEKDWPQWRRHMQSLLASDTNQAAYLAAYIIGLIERNEADEAELWLARLETISPAALQTIELKARVLVAQGKADQALALVQAVPTNLQEPADGPRAEPGVLGLLLEQLAEQARRPTGDGQGGEGRGEGASRTRGRGDAGTRGRGDNDSSNLQPSAILLSAAEARFREQAAQNPRYRTTLAGFLGRHERVAEAIDEYQKCWQDCPAGEVALGLAGLAVQGSPPADQVQRISKALAEAAKREPDSLEVQSALAQLHDAQGNYAEACRRYRAIIAQDADNVLALNNLALLLALRRAGKEESLKLIDLAIEAAGPAGALLDSRAMVRVALGRFDQAVADALEAVADRPAANRRFHLAQAYDGKQDAQSATAALDEALEEGLTEKSLHPLERPALRSLMARLGMKDEG